MDIFGNAKKHFADKVANGPREIIVPEWGDDSGPAKIYVWPETVEEKSEIMKAGRDSDIDAGVMALILRAKDEDRKRLFSKAQRIEIRKQIDFGVLDRVIAEIYEDTSIEEAEKN